MTTDDNDNKNRSQYAMYIEKTTVSKIIICHIIQYFTSGCPKIVTSDAKVHKCSKWYNVIK